MSELSKVIVPIADYDIKLWDSIRERLRKALNEEKTILKNDLKQCFMIHKRVFLKPNTAPSINCCIDIQTWLMMCDNIDNACGYLEAKEEDPIEQAVKKVATKRKGKAKK